MKKHLLGVAAFAVMLGAIGLGAGCSSHPAPVAPVAPVADVAYAPSVYGENGACYYVNDPQEVVALQQAGYCQPTWRPMVMPPTWLYMYAAFYTSPAYYGVYVPVGSRVTYQNTYNTTWTTQHRTEIDRSSSNAKWKGTDGKDYPGDKVAKDAKSGKASFQSGNVRSEGFSSGKTRDPVKKNDQPKVDAPKEQPKPKPAPPAKPAPAPNKPPAPPKSNPGGGSKSGGSSGGSRGGSSGGGRR